MNKMMIVALHFDFMPSKSSSTWKPEYKFLACSSQLVKFFWSEEKFEDGGDILKPSDVVNSRSKVKAL